MVGSVRTTTSSSKALDLGDSDRAIQAQVGLASPSIITFQDASHCWSDDSLLPDMGMQKSNQV